MQDVEVKGWRNGLLLILPQDGEWNEIVEQVHARLDEAKARSFWRGAQTTIDCGARSVTLPELEALIERAKRGFGLVPVAVVATDPQTRAAAEKLALTVYEELPAIKKPPPKPTPGELRQAKEQAASNNAPANNALYLFHTVRSGQRIVHEGGHLVIGGDVNAGAEVVAAGDVVVFGSLRGLAHAGAFGDESARIVAANLRPPQLRIASKIARAPEESSGGGSDRAGHGSGGGARHPEVARIENGEIGVFPL